MSTDVAVDYLTAITSAILTAPRSLQKAPGPSELGSPCARRIGYKLLGMPRNDQRPNWKATVGTGVHLWLAEAFAADNEREPRWLIETKVGVGFADRHNITGHCDLYDIKTGTVIDHKTAGPTMLKKYKKQGAGQQYETQGHLYGRGWQLKGFPVKQVMITFLPRQGELDDMYIWGPHPYDEQIAIDALQRVAGIQAAIDVLGWEALAALPTAEAYCVFCDYYRHKSQDLRKGCPGDPSVHARQSSAKTFEGIV